MKRILMILGLLILFSVPVCAQEITAPPPPGDAEALLPEDRDSFAEGLWYVIRSSLELVRPDITAALKTCLGVFGAVLMLSILQSFQGQGKSAAQLCGVVIMGVLLLEPANALISLGAQTVKEISDYVNLLLPVMTAALAAQGGVSSSGILYTATAFVNSLLGSAVSGLLIPAVYIYLALSLVSGVSQEPIMDKMKDFIKWLMTWGLKICLYVFTGFMSITGVISGTADKTALKATKLTISGMVPVVGGILSDASDTVILSAGVMKNAAGIYGMLAILAIFLAPFFRIGLHYLTLKLTGALCGVFAEKKITGILWDFSGAMGMILAMTGTLCLMMLVSMVCFMKGVG